MDTATGEMVEQQFTVGVRPELQVSDVFAGEIAVRAGEDAVVRVRAARHGALRKLDDAPFRADQRGDLVRISASSPLPIELEIEVPRGCAIDIRTVNADVTVAGTEEAVFVETVEGSTSVEGLAGDCRLVSVSSDASARNLRGTLTWNTASGNIEVSDSNLRGCTFQNMSGDFTVETSLSPGGQYLVSTVSGDLRLYVPPDTGASVLLKTVSGTASSTLPTEVVRADRRHWEGRINGGGAIVEMTSMSGNLYVTPRSDRSPVPQPASVPGPAATQPVAPVAGPSPKGSVTPAPEADIAGGSEAAAEPIITPASRAVEDESSDRTTEILRALERGEMDVEEAMSRLEGDR